MRKLFIMLIIASQLLYCFSVKGQESRNRDIAGIYYLKSNKLYQALSDKNYSSIEINEDGTYTLNKADISFSPVIEQCSYASKGRWSIIEDNLLEITSEDYYIKQRGFDYEIKKENKYSQDSLYIQVLFPTDFHPVTLNLTFNNLNNKSVTTDNPRIVLSKLEYLWDEKKGITTNQIDFNLNANIVGTKLYKGRIWFDIFNETIDTKKHNYLTIFLPYFDRCFFEFEPYCQELIYIKDSGQLFWQGEIWEKVN